MRFLPLSICGTANVEPELSTEQVEKTDPKTKKAKPVNGLAGALKNQAGLYG